MITATMFESVVEVQISGDPSQFAAGLEEFKMAILPSDRRYDEFKKVWVVKRPEVYQDLPYIAKALKAREQQLSLF